MGKQWRDFEVLYALFLRQRHPLRQAAEIEAIPCAERVTLTSCTVVRSPPTAVSSGGVNSGVSSILTRHAPRSSQSGAVRASNPG